MNANQLFLALGALLLLMIVTTTLNRTYILALTETIDNQLRFEAVNFAQSLTELVFSASEEYDQIDALLANRDDIQDPNKRFTRVTQFGDSLFATITLTPDTTLQHGVTGRLAAIQVYSRQNGTFVAEAETRATINRR
ncbi:MAG: hypothetical protein LAT75_07915 [Candidatus Cyclonatronum sp.]|uniref:hypothetical protein n=1 Tax=Cyclonatronum sp. TaxID=3024185 RepID=UPI0025C2A325|nr:hypothetical protein [Cyclonatronum sp.]MCH8486776.1 hypothetical protein [Cyclonatronum sp.]